MIFFRGFDVPNFRQGSDSLTKRLGDVVSSKQFIRPQFPLATTYKQSTIALIHNTIDKLYEFNCIIKLKELLYNLNVARFNSTKNVYYSWSLMPNCLNFIDQYYKNKAVLFPFVL